MTKPLHSLSPQELADQGIPVEVALRARIEKFYGMAETFKSDFGSGWANGGMEAYRDALAIIEAKS